MGHVGKLGDFYKASLPGTDGPDAPWPQIPATRGDAQSGDVAPIWEVTFWWVQNDGIGGFLLPSGNLT
jgi:hypothetical protein